MKTAIESAMERAKRDLEYWRESAKRLRRDAEKSAVFDEKENAERYLLMAMEDEIKAGEYEIMLEALKYYHRNESHQDN